MKKITILYQDCYETIDDIASKSKFMIEEPTPIDGFTSTEFESGTELIDYMEREKLLQDKGLPFEQFMNWVYTKLALFPTYIGI